MTTFAYGDTSTLPLRRALHGLFRHFFYLPKDHKHIDKILGTLQSSASAHQMRVVINKLLGSYAEMFKFCLIGEIIITRDRLSSFWKLLKTFVRNKEIPVDVTRRSLIIPGTERVRGFGVFLGDLNGYKQMLEIKDTQAINSISFLFNREEVKLHYTPFESIMQFAEHLFRTDIDTTLSMESPFEFIMRFKCFYQPIEQILSQDPMIYFDVAKENIISKYSKKKKKKSKIQEAQKNMIINHIQPLLSKNYPQVALCFTEKRRMFASVTFRRTLPGVLRDFIIAVTSKSKKKIEVPTLYQDLSFIASHICLLGDFPLLKAFEQAFPSTYEPLNKNAIFVAGTVNLKFDDVTIKCWDAPLLMALFGGSKEITVHLANGKKLPSDISEAFKEHCENHLGVKMEPYEKQVHNRCEDLIEDNLM